MYTILMILFGMVLATFVVIILFSDILENMIMSDEPAVFWTGVFIVIFMLVAFMKMVGFN